MRLRSAPRILALLPGHRLRQQTSARSPSPRCQCRCLIGLSVGIHHHRHHLEAFHSMDRTECEIRGFTHRLGVSGDGHCHARRLETVVHHANHCRTTRSFTARNVCIWHCLCSSQHRLHNWFSYDCHFGIYRCTWFCIRCNQHCSLRRGYGASRQHPHRHTCRRQRWPTSRITKWSSLYGQTGSGLYRAYWSISFVVLVRCN